MVGAFPWEICVCDFLEHKVSVNIIGLQALEFRVCDW
jgi:hypothetical protein